jgi:hypothetical protein
VAGDDPLALGVALAGPGGRGLDGGPRGDLPLDGGLALGDEPVAAVALFD